jgi:Uma2 family endonuclease
MKTRLGSYTYADYKTWPDEERWELIEGRAWAMSPAPSLGHQDILGKLYMSFGSFLKGKPCKVFLAPFDVLLPAGEEVDDEIETVVQPDLAVYCDKSRLTRAGAKGAPDIAAEILSPSTSRKDQREKFDLYQRHGVREYWVIDPLGAWLCVYRLLSPGALATPGPASAFDEGELREQGKDFGPVGSHVLSGFAIDPGELFAELP